MRNRYEEDHIVICEPLSMLKRGRIFEKRVAAAIERGYSIMFQPTFLLTFNQITGIVMMQRRRSKSGKQKD